MDFAVEVMQYFYHFNNLKGKEKKKLNLLRNHGDEAWRIRKVVTTNTTDWFLSYCQQSYVERNAELKSRGQKMVESKQYESVMYITVTGKGVEFGASWVDDVDRVYMPLNLDHHWVLVKMNLKDRTISVGNYGIFTLKVIELLPTGLPLDVITSSNIPAL
ncbi:unnamed protein product [Malus baccata var. baccata]